MVADGKAVALLDWDGTLRPGILLLDWAEFLAQAGFTRPQEVAAMLDMAGEYRAGRLSYDNFVSRVVSHFALSLGGVRTEEVRQAARDFAEHDSERLFPICRPLIAFLKDCGIEPVLISGSPVEPLREHAARLGVGRVLATELGEVEGRYTGAVVRNMAERASKEGAVRSLAGSSKLAFGIGDRPADASLVNLARVGAFAASDSTEAPAGFREDVLRLDVSWGTKEIERALAGLREASEAGS